MVAKISPGRNIRRMVNYNEQKVMGKKAVCIGSGNLPLDPHRMGFDMKVAAFDLRNELNERTKVNGVHISLNFHPSESHLSDAKMMEIAERYMDGLGFGQQPFFVYRHFDAGHPHVHIVTTNIRADGSRISLNRLANRCSEPARKEIEKLYGLVAAEGQKGQGLHSPRTMGAEQLSYGKLELKAAIQKILDHAYGGYSYASLAELNAVLSQYNVRADRGAPDSRTFIRGGILIRALGQDGLPVGVPLKASLFYPAPTLKKLEAKFLRGAINRAPHRSRIANAIETAMAGRPHSLSELGEELQKKGIVMILRQNDRQRIYGLTFVDHVTKCVFNGSAVGKGYSAAKLIERCGGKDATAHPPLTQHAANIEQEGGLPIGKLLDIVDVADALDLLTADEQVFNYVPKSLKRRRKKKR